MRKLLISILVVALNSSCVVSEKENCQQKIISRGDLNMEACYGLMLLWGDPYDRRGPASQEAIDFFNEVCLIGFLNEKYCSNKSGKPVLRSSEFEGR